MTPQEIIKEIRKLPATDWQAIRDTIEKEPSGAITEDELEERLQAKGILGAVPSPKIAAADDWEPVEIDGPPLSETIISERR